MLYRRKKSKCWYCEFTIQKKRFRFSTGTADKAEAEAIEHRKTAEIWRQIQLGTKPAYTWDDAFHKWFAESDKRSIDQDRIIIKWLRENIAGIGDLPLRNTTRQTLLSIRNRKAKTTSKSTANRYMCLVRAILNTAKDTWEWLDSVPKTPMYQLETSEPRFITESQLKALLNLLPKHLAVMAEFAAATGMRKANECGLTWDRVDFARRIAWVPAMSSKSKKTVKLRLNQTAIDILVSQRGKHPERVFTYKGRPIGNTNTKAFRTAVKKAGIAPFRWHDLRHTWASWHVQNGTPLAVLKELGNWSSYEMVLKYAHLGEDHLSQYADNIGPKKLGLRVVN